VYCLMFIHPKSTPPLDSLIRNWLYFVGWLFPLLALNGSGIGFGQDFLEIWGSFFQKVPGKLCEMYQQDRDRQTVQGKLGTVSAYSIQRWLRNRVFINTMKQT